MIVRPATAEDRPASVRTAVRAFALDPFIRHLMPDDLLAPAWPAAPHWYLGVLATHPDWQGNGLASALLAPVLSAADDDALDAYLVTATPSNVAFYRRHGFDVHGEVDLRDGPRVWMLVRRPAALAD